VAPCIAKVDQGVQISITHGVHAAPATPVSTVRPAEGNELFPPEAHAPVAAISRDHLDGCFVDKLHRTSLEKLPLGRLVHPKGHQKRKGPGVPGPSESQLEA